MPIVVPAMIDREDTEKFIRLVTGDAEKKADRQDYSPIVASEMVGEGYINDEDIYSKIREVAAAAP